MNRVVITGATSMIGVALINECIKQNIEVLAIVRKGSQRIGRLPFSDLLKIYECNMEQLEMFSNFSEKYDVFYHFAWDFTAKSMRNNPILQEKNVKYTLEAVELAHKLGCKKFIGAGSQAEYGKVEDVISPYTPISPRIAYGVAKYTAGKLSEFLCRQYGMIHIWGRIFSVYGQNDNEGTMLNYAIDQFLKGELAKFSAATQMWDYLHETDAGRIFYLLGEIVEKSKTYCIANGNARQLKDFIMELKDMFEDNAICVFEDSTDNNDIIGFHVDTSDLFEDINYTPQISFKEGIRDMIQYRTKVRGGGRPSL